MLMLKRFFSFLGGKVDGRIGYVYVSDRATGPIKFAQAGQVVRVEGRGPPWIVVDEAPESAILAKWPGKLWKVKIVEAATPFDQRNNGGPPLAYAKYTRAISVETLEEMDVAVLFGEGGEQVLKVLNHAEKLTREEAQKFSAARHIDAADAYNRVFRIWANANGLNVDDHDNLDGTLKIGMSPSSPINEGLSVLYQVIYDRAEVVDGAKATQIDDEGEIDLLEPWSGACATLGDAALALGSADFANEADLHILLSGWIKQQSSSLNE